MNADAPAKGHATKCFGGCPRAAAYIWTARPSGNDVPLCAECCAAWRADLATDAQMSPLRIRSVGDAA